MGSTLEVSPEPTEEGGLGTEMTMWPKDPSATVLVEVRYSPSRSKNDRPTRYRYEAAIGKTTVDA